MKKLIYSLAHLTTISLITTSTGYSARALTLTPPRKPSAYLSEQPYITGDGGEGVVYLKELGLVSTPSLESNFMQLLQSEFQDWSFSVSQQTILGSFDINRYKAIGLPSNQEGYSTAAVGFLRGPYVGAELQFAYSPCQRNRIDCLYFDPAPPRKLHWIQWVRSNHMVAKTPNGTVIEEQHGIEESKIDIANGQTDPYYDTFFGPADEYFFYDIPGRVDITEDHDWTAVLYLVEETAPKTVTIYSGIEWGWTNEFTPTPTQKFTDSLSAGETDTFNLNDLTPGLNFFAWIDNDLPQNRCNPNTYLNTFSDGEYYYDDDSSFLGDGFASAFTGKVPKSGSLDLFVSANGSRGEDSGSYDLYVKVYAEGEKPPKNLVPVGGSGEGYFQILS